MSGIYQAEILNEGYLDPIVERQAVLIALKHAEQHGVGDFRITTAVNGCVDIVDIKVYLI